MPDFALILPAAGRSTRFGGPRNKLLEPLDGVPVVVRSIRAFQGRSDVVRIVVPTSDVDGLTEELARWNLHIGDRLDICPGGASRAHSVLAALKRVPESIDWVAIHDGARPLVSQQMIDRAFTAATVHGAAVPALPVALTIKEATGPLPARVMRTVPRQSLWAMQTPQAMRRADLLAAFDSCPLPLDQVTDDVQLLELIGMPVWLVEGEERNLKITTPLDLKIAGLLLEESKASSDSARS